MAIFWTLGMFLYLDAVGLHLSSIETFIVHLRFMEFSFSLGPLV